MNDQPGRILVVDDTAASRYITVSWLRRGGHEVTEAETAAAALSILADQLVDLVVLDVNLPDANGFDVCEQIKADPRTAALPVIHLSATYIRPSDRARGLTRGADAYLTEPVDPGELSATVLAALRYYRARSAAERLAHRLSLLSAASLSLSEAGTFAELMARSVRSAARIFDCPAASFVALADGRERRADITGPDGSVTTHDEPAGTISRLAAASLSAKVGVALGTVAGLDERLGSKVVAVFVRTNKDWPPICLALPADAVTESADRNLLQQLGQATAQAAQGLRAYAAEHNLALTLQRSLLPMALPSDPRLSMAARYQPASTEAEIGGDFYEVAELDGTMLIAIGDVAGHSIAAATVMGEVRHALRAYAVEGHGPSEILLRLDAMLRRFHPRAFTTLCVMVADPVAGTVDVANAGHIPPLFVDDAGARYVTLPGQLLGIGGKRPPATRLPLPVGTTVVLMTDGLVERRGFSIDEDLEALRASVGAEDLPEAICTRLLAQFGRDKDDDIALLVFRRTGD